MPARAPVPESESAEMESQAAKSVLRRPFQLPAAEQFASRY